AFEAAINRVQFAQIGCAKGTTCKPADTGLIAAGLYGNLAPQKDPMAVYDPSKAKAEYQKWDPTGQKAASLKLEYESTPTLDTQFQNVQAQLQSTLGVKMQLSPSDFKTIISDREAHRPYLFEDSWGADYNHPQDWYDNLWSCTNARDGGGNGSAYCDPQMDSLVQSADQKPLAQGLSQYNQAYQMMEKNDYGAPLDYSTIPFFVQKWVSGESNNGLNDASWTNIKILQH
ncbi:MAG: ABC transporter substrate-binding protein, partial [Candidatus Dormiibacterota bacterium]